MQPISKQLRSGHAFFALLAAALMMIFTVSTLSAQDDAIQLERPQKQGGALSNSSKSVSADKAAAGDTLSYSVVISNSAGSPISAQMVDVMPAGLTLIGSSATSNIYGGSQTSFSITGNKISWSGDLNGGGYAVIAFDATLAAGLTIGTIITNSANISRTGESLTVSAGTTIADPADLVDLSGSTKTASPTTVPTGGKVNYTVTIMNAGSYTATNVMMSDQLPANLSHVAGTLTASAGTPAVNGNVISWNGSVNPNSVVAIQFQAQDDGALPPGNAFSNTAVITGTDGVYSPSVAVQVSTQYLVYMPIIAKALHAPILNATRPNSANEWTMFWQNAPTGIIGFELQEAKEPDFTNPTSYNLGVVTTQPINQIVSSDNNFYYRIRAVAAGNSSGWSNVVHVIGAYRDDFNNPNSGWAIRRTTYLEEVRSWYENNDWLILQVEDSWDWGIASPLKMQAPEPPYAIEYRSQPANLGNLVSHGAVFGADFPGDNCPDYNTFDGVYKHALCFNHFYNTNTIWFGDLKLLFERVDFLQWLPNAGGSPMKRGSFDNYQSWFTVARIPNVDADGWNTYRIEVRDSGIKLFANGQLYAETGDTQWLNDRHFGVFASTDEYSNSTWRFDYYQATPIDN